MDRRTMGGGPAAERTSGGTRRLEDRAGPIDGWDGAASIPPRPGCDRPSAIPSLEAVNVFTADASQELVMPHPRLDPSCPARLQNRLLLRAWVSDAARIRRVWVDAYLVGPGGRALHAETFTFEHLGPAGAGGDLYVLDTAVTSPRFGVTLTEAEEVQYRLYCREREGDLFTDGILHRHRLAPELLDGMDRVVMGLHPRLRRPRSPARSGRAPV